MTIEYELSEAQQTIALCDKRFRLACTGRRFGKTFLAYEEMFRMATSKAATDKGGYNIWYVANTSDNARRLMWTKYLTSEKYVPARYVAKKHDQRMILTFKNGSTISVFTAEEPDSLRGSAIDFLVMDECAFCNKNAWKTIYPALTDKFCEGRVLLISSPDGYNWFWELYSKHIGKDDDWGIFHFTTLEGGNVTQEKIEKARQELSAKEFRKEYLASFETMADRIYEDYDTDENNIKEINPDWGTGDIHIGMDFNVRPMTAAISVIETDKEGNDSIFFFDEIVTSGFSNTQQMCDKIKSRYPKATVYVYPDPTGNKHQPSAPIGVTDMTILRDNGFIVCAPRAPYASKDKWNTVNTAMCTADGTRKVFVSKEKCPHLSDSLNGFVFKENGEPDKSQGFDHITDAMAYEICYKLPIRRAKLYRPRMYGA